MKNTGIVITVLAVALLIWQFISPFLADFCYEKAYSYHWELADKSSTIPSKQKHIRDFVQALEDGNARGQFSSHSAIFLQTSNNEFRANIEALKTLSQRLSEIQDMQPSSFEYNTAIQQITAQEQGEAQAMLTVFDGCYKLSQWPWVVFPWGGVVAICELLILAGGICLWAEGKQREDY